MSRNFAVPINLNNLEIQNVKAQILASDPTAVEAKFYYNASDDTFRFYNGIQWITLGRIDQLIAPTNNVSWGNQRIINLQDPVNAQDAATKLYVDNAVQGLDAKASVKAATVSNITLSGEQTVDGVALVAGDRVLVKNQTTLSQNGIYTVAAGSWLRSIDMNTWLEVPNAFTFVEQGDINADTGWVCQADQGGTLETTAITFALFSSAGTFTASNLTPVSAGSSTAGVFKQKTGNNFEFYTLNTPAGQNALMLSTNVANNTVDLTVAALLESITDLATNGLIARTGTGTAASRSLVQPAAGITIGNADGAAGNPTFTLANDLAAVEGLATTGLAVRTATDTWTTRTLTQPAAGITITNPAGLAGNPTFALSNDLGALEALAGTGFAVRTGTDTWAQRSLTTAAGSKITVTDGTGVAGNPTFDIIDSWKIPARAATTGANYTLTGGTPSTLDGVSLATNDRILVKDQTSAAQNGIYTVTTVGTGTNGTWTRALDFNTSAEALSGTSIVVTEGTISGSTKYQLVTMGTITLDTTALTFTAVSGLGLVSAGAGLVKGTGATKDQIDIELATTSGLSFDAAGVAGKLQIDRTLVVTKFGILIGNNAATSFAVTHNLNMKEVIVSVYEVSTGDLWETDVVVTSVNVVTVSFAIAPTTNQYYVIVHG